MATRTAAQKLIDDCWGHGCDDALDGLPNRNPYTVFAAHDAYENGYRVGNDPTIGGSEDSMAERRALGETACD